jgi:hypothetical protein
MVAGNVAELDDELKAINWAGRIPLKNVRTLCLLSVLIAKE